MIDAHGSTLEILSRDLDIQFPGMRFRMIDEQDNIRPHIKVFVNKRQVNDLGVAIGESDEVDIIQAFSGG